MRNVQHGQPSLPPMMPAPPSRPLPLRQDEAMIRMNPGTTARQRRHLLLDLPIVWRLSLGFLVAALIAAAAAGLTGLQRAQSSSNEADFYQNLLAANTTLTTANSFLQLLNTQVHTTLTDVTAPTPSSETISTDENALQALTNRYDSTLSGYTRQDLLQEHTNEVALLNEAGHSGQVTQQNTLVASVLRTWNVYRDAQTQVLQDVMAGNLTDAQALERSQGEPTNADAQSALRALIQFNSSIAATARAATQVEQQNQLITSLIAALIAFLGIALVGWVISETLVRRLNQLRAVTLAVEEGDIGQRVTVAGRDEVAGVSAAVNGMLDTIVGLLDVTRRQRDALTNAAERLFSDVRIAGAGNLRINAAVTSDPIGMLANAFNFTIGRFRRFVLRTQTTVEQLDVLARHQVDRAEAFRAATQQYAQGEVVVNVTPNWLPKATSGRLPEYQHTAPLQVRQRLEHSRELVRRIAREGANSHSRAALDYAEQAYISAGRLSQLALSATVALDQRSASGVHQALRSQMDELQTLGRLLGQVSIEAQSIQKNTAMGLADLDADLEQLSVFVESVPAQSATMPSTSNLNSAQVYELIRISSVFANDMTKMARQITAVNQEMRAGVTQFSLNTGDSASQLYMPGTGYGEASIEYGPFGMPMPTDRSQVTAKNASGSYSSPGASSTNLRQR